MYLMWKAAKRNGDWWRRGWGHSPLMQVAQRFRVPVREVRDIIDAQKGPRP
jgi:hypothetical protein